MLVMRTESVFSPHKADMLLKVCSNTMAPGGGGGGNAKKLPFGGDGGPHVSFSDLPPDMLKLIVEEVFEGDVKSTRLARVSQDVLCSVNDVKKTIQFAWWSGESAASLPMSFQDADLPVVKSQLINEVQVMNQRSFTNAFLQVRGCDKEDVFRIIKDEWLTNFSLRIIVHLMGHDNAYTDIQMGRQKSGQQVTLSFQRT